MKKAEISAKLIDAHESFIDFISGLDESEFVYSFDGKWTAGQQLDHLVRAVGPVKTAFSLPKFVPSMLFGKSKRESLEYDRIVERYQGKLATGSKASGRFIPKEIAFADLERLVARLDRNARGLAARIEQFSEEQLDLYRLPHPILGKLTLREMLYFTIYHTGHHHRATVRNLENK